MQITPVDPTLLRPNPWNTNVVSPDSQAKIEASLLRHGWIRPVIVRETEEGLEILGGQHRVEAAIALGMDEVPVVNLGAVDEARAKEIGLIDNARYGQDDATLLSELLAELGAEVIDTTLPFSTEELAALGSDVEIDFDALGVETPEEEAPKPAKAVRTHVMQRFKVPIDDADRVTDTFEAIMREQGFTDSDSLSNAGDALVWLVDQFNRGGDE